MNISPVRYPKEVKSPGKTLLLPNSKQELFAICLMYLCDTHDQYRVTFDKFKADASFWQLLCVCFYCSVLSFKPLLPQDPWLPLSSWWSFLLEAVIFAVKAWACFHVFLHVRMNVCELSDLDLYHRIKQLARSSHATNFKRFPSKFKWVV